MKKGKSIVLITSIVVLSLCFLSINVVADPTINSVTTDPENPTWLSTVKVSATVNGDDVTGVLLKLGECQKGFACYVWTDYIMTDDDQDGVWEATATLKDESGRTDYLSCIFVVTDGGQEYELDEDWEVDLTIDTSNNGNGDSSTNGSPGFELLTLLVAVGIGFIILRRKRL